jgi:D-alanyl-lipoteichoic acid acyltransferase DltB (MBOAT superfamily)
VLFNSIEFAFFLLIVFLIYWLARSTYRIQNLLLLVASYVFYGWWDWRFLILLILVSLFNYLIGIKIDASRINWHRKVLLITGLVINLGTLGLLKYFNFFIEGFIDFVSLLGYQIKGTAIDIILPLGLSFYIFLSLSYLLDIFKGNTPADKNIIHVLLSLGFFPIILAGPIQRPSTLLPQIRAIRVFDYQQVSDGLRQILWGLFVKIAVADNLAPFVNEVFNSYSSNPGSTLFVGALFYTIQIYADFSGYSHIAIGTANILGFRLMKNFDYPYFARDITDFWKRWHISLTTWFRDYLFLPVSFSIAWRIKTRKVLFIKTDLFIYIIASLLTWLLTGLWHGANYTFLIWGLLHGLLLIFYKWQLKPRKRILKKLKIDNDNILLSFTESMVTFLFVVITWVIFRSASVRESMEYIKGMFAPSLFSNPGDLPVKEIALALLFLIIEFRQRGKNHALQFDKLNSAWVRWSIYASLVLIILFFGGGAQQFIYFQF